MSKTKPTYIFSDPNPPKAVEALLRRILTEKLRTLRKARQ